MTTLTSFIPQVLSLLHNSIGQRSKVKILRNHVFPQCLKEEEEETGENMFNELVRGQSNFKEMQKQKNLLISSSSIPAKSKSNKEMKVPVTDGEVQY